MGGAQLDCTQEPVPFPGYCFDKRRVPEGFPQRVYVVSEVILFDHRVRPDRRDEVVFLYEATGPGHKHTESIENLSSQTDRAPVT